MSKAVLWIVTASVLIYLALAFTTSAIKTPWEDEGWIASAPPNWVRTGGWDQSLDPTASWLDRELTGIREITYWNMPVVLFGQAESMDLPGHYGLPSLSPDAGTTLLTRVGPGGSEIYTLSFATRQLTRVSLDRPQPRFPVWSGDGQSFVFSSDGDLIVHTPGEPLRALPRLPVSRQFPEDWSTDGRMVFTAQIGDRLNALYVLEAGITKQLLSEAEASEARCSPDGRQIALTWNRNGRRDVYTARFPLSDANPVRISDHGGHSPAWANGELSYLSAAGDLMASGRPLFHIAAAVRPDYEYRHGGYCVGRQSRLLFTFLKQPPPQL